MSSDYILVGFINIFNIIPDFVVPVFKNAIENLYCIQYIEDDKIVLDKFSDFNESFYLSNVEFYNILDSKYEQVDLEKNDILKKLPGLYYKHNFAPYKQHKCVRFANLDEPIFAFQTECNIFYGKTNSFISFLNDFETDDGYLKEEIDDFKENIDKFKNMETRNDICIEDTKYEEIKLEFPEIPTVDLIKSLRGSFAFHRKPKVGLDYIKSIPVEITKECLEELNNGKYYHFRIGCKEPDERKALLEKLDQQLRNTPCSSEEYKYLIASIYELLFDTQNYDYSNFYNPYKYSDIKK